MNRFSRPAQKRRKAQNRPRQVAAVIAIGGCLGFAAFGTDAYVVAKRQIAAVAAKAPKTVVAATNDDEIYTGSILYVPDTGNFCRQLLFNNQNGLFVDNGYVDCERAAYRGVSEDAARYWPVARVRVISDGFRGH